MASVGVQPTGGLIEGPGRGKESIYYLRRENIFNSRLSSLQGHDNLCTCPSCEQDSPSQVKQPLPPLSLSPGLRRTELPPSRAPRPCTAPGHLPLPLPPKPFVNSPGIKPTSNYPKLIGPSVSCWEPNWYSSIKDVEKCK